jgi:hypothetical protein
MAESFVVVVAGRVEFGSGGGCGVGGFIRGLAPPTFYGSWQWVTAAGDPVASKIARFTFL